MDVVSLLAELGLNVKTPNVDGTTPAFMAALNDHAEVLRLLAKLGADVQTPRNDGCRPLAISAAFAHLSATQTLLLLGAPVAVQDLRQYTEAPGNTRQLRADLQTWAADALTQHRTFHDTFLHGTSAHEVPHPILLSMLGGVKEVRERVGSFVGVFVGTELRHLRAVGPAIAAVDWAAHDQPWAPPMEEEEEEEEEEQEEGEGP